MILQSKVLASLGIIWVVREGVLTTSRKCQFQCLWGLFENTWLGALDFVGLPGLNLLTYQGAELLYYLIECEIG